MDAKYIQCIELIKFNVTLVSIMIFTFSFLITIYNP